MYAIKKVYGAFAIGLGLVYGCTPNLEVRTEPVTEIQIKVVQYAPGVPPTKEHETLPAFTCSENGIPTDTTAGEGKDEFVCYVLSN